MRMHFLCAAILGGAFSASAHLGAITTPAAGSTVTPGQSVTIRWSIGSAHNTQDLAYSQDGTTWTTITTGLGANANNYVWTVPNKPSTTTRLRVCQRDGAQVQGCTDAHNAQRLTSAYAVSGGEVYTAISGNFTISGGTGVAERIQASGTEVRFNAATGSVEAVFELARAERVTLKAFDTQGKLITVLLDVEKVAGRHVLSVQSGALDLNRKMVLKLQAGDVVIHQGSEGGL